MNENKLQKILKLISENNVDAILIYNSKDEEPSYIPWFLEENIIDNCYLLLDKNGQIKFFIAGWFLDIAKNHYKKDIEYIGTFHKKGMLKEIIPFLEKYESLGLAGDIPYKDFELLKNKKTISIEENLGKIFSIKSEEELKILVKVRKNANKILEEIVLKDGMTELELEKSIKNKVENIGYNISFLSIAGYETLKEATVGFAGNNLIKNGDAICIDFGINKFGYHSDQTKCYFLGENYLKEKYEFIKNLVKSYSGFIKVGKNSKEVLKEIIDFTEKQNGIDDYFFHDIGHGIGSYYHEFPDIYHNDFIYQKGMIFTIEPEYKFGERLIRYEDMFYINENGDCICLEDLNI